MATKEITKQGPRYADPDLERGLMAVPGDTTESESKFVARIGQLWQSRMLLFRWAAIGFIVSTVIVLLIPARYTSTTELMPPDQAGQGMASMLAALGKAGEGLGAIGGELLGLKTSGDLFIGVLRSRTVQDDVINKFDLRKVYGSRRYESTRKQLEDRTELASDRKSGIIMIRVSDRNPDRAAAIGREYVEALNRVVNTLNTSSAHKERVFLEGRLVEVQGGLEEAEKNFSQFASKNVAIDVKEQGRAMIGATAELEGELIAAQTELEGLRQIYTPNNVRVRSVQARIDEYRRQLQKLGGKPPSNADDDTSASAGASDQGADLYPSIRRLPILGVRWADLYRQIKVQEAVFETLTKQYELAKVEEARETPSVKVLDGADVPERKSFPPRTVLVCFGTVLVLALGAAWVLGHARWEEIDPRDPGKMLAGQIFQTVETNVSKIASFVSRKKTPPDGS